VEQQVVPTYFFFEILEWQFIFSAFKYCGISHQNLVLLPGKLRKHKFGKVLTSDSGLVGTPFDGFTRDQDLPGVESRHQGWVGAEELAGLTPLPCWLRRHLRVQQSRFSCSASVMAKARACSNNHFARWAETAQFNRLGNPAAPRHPTQHPRFATCFVDQRAPVAVLRYSAA